MKLGGLEEATATGRKLMTLTGKAGFEIKALCRCRKNASWPRAACDELTRSKFGVCGNCRSQSRILTHRAQRSLSVQRGLIHGCRSSGGRAGLPRMWSDAFSPTKIEGALRLP